MESVINSIDCMNQPSGEDRRLGSLISKTNMTREELSYGGVPSRRTFGKDFCPRQLSHLMRLPQLGLELGNIVLDL